jgi:glutamine---fructose-6-phosphate transaminase (isomerizing)
MCGIFGISIRHDAAFSYEQWQSAVRDLFLLSESRGKEAAGIALATPHMLLVHKDSVSAGEMLKTNDYLNVISRAKTDFFDASNKTALSAIGHARLVTNGLQGIDANNQPVRRDDVVIIHNGIVVNVDNLWAELKPEGIEPRADVDTEVIAAMLQRSINRGDHAQKALCDAFGKIYGETSVAVFLKQQNIMLLGSNTGSMHYAFSKDSGGFFFTSEHLITKRLCDGDKAIPGFAGAIIVQLKAGMGAVLNLTTHAIETFALAGKKLTAPASSPMLATQRAIEDKSERYRNAMKSMQRCTKCILPETMPFIDYDVDGVCNYCRTYKPWVKRPESELEERLDRIRSKDGSPDCIVGFSGGRDSSYGLHLLKEKYRMTPLTFSYDWGMVTDLARRNQARICGKLGIEHIWISADIKLKRAHIRRNVLAWLKKPDLGLIPLFMAGDKEVLWHANKLMETYKINDMAFCTNELEKTVFKQGFLGVDARETRVGKPSTLPWAGKLGMLWKYGRRFASNPAYFNRSMPDTLFAFFSYYVIQQNYFSLFDYMPWDEDQINKALIEGYDWETAKDTRSTWRIGDGTAPFYNYIYNSVAGFSEYDTFRSNQIREGQLTRAQAIALVEEENLPRFGSIREYTQMINIDFDETIRIIDRIPKLYLRNTP